MGIQKQRQQVRVFVLILYTFTLDISKAAWCSIHEFKGHSFPVNTENKVDLKEELSVPELQIHQLLDSRDKWILSLVSFNM